MYAKSSDNELAEFIRSEMLDFIPFRGNDGKESEIPYKDFFARLCQRETLTPHLQLVSCITPIDEFYPAIYDCFREDYGQIDFDLYPQARRKFSPSLFTLCLDFVNQNLVIRREYTRQGKNIAYLEKLLYSEIHYVNPESGEEKCVYYKDFLAKVMKTEEKKGSSLGMVMLEAQEILLSNSQKVEINENILLMFSDIFDGVISPPGKITKEIRPTYREDLNFMFSSVGIYTCINHINKIGDLNVLLPVIYTVSVSKRKKSKRIPIVVALIVLTLLIVGLVKMYY